MFEAVDSRQAIGQTMVSALSVLSTLRSCLRLCRLAAWFGLAVCLPVTGMAQPSTPVGDVGVSTQADVWTLRCVNVAMPAVPDAQPAARVACEAGQTVIARQGDQDVEVLKLAISSIGEAGGKPQWGLVALLPLDVLLSSDFGLGADKVKPGVHRYRNCNHLGCFAVVPLTGKLAAGLGRSEKGTAYFRLVNGKAVKVVFPLAGFADAFGKLSSGKDLPPATTPAEPVAAPEVVR